MTDIYIHIYEHEAIQKPKSGRLHSYVNNNIRLDILHVWLQYATRVFKCRLVFTLLTVLSQSDCAVLVEYRSTFSMEKDLEFLEDAVKITGIVLPVLFEFGSEMKVLAEQVIRVLAEVDDEEIKQMHSVKTALYKLLSVLECAYAFLDKVDDVFYYCQSDTMKAAREGLALSPPDLKPLRDLMGQLGICLAQAQHKYAEFVSACNEATHSCGEAEMACARKEREYRNKKKTTKGVGGAAAGAALVGGTAAATGGVVATGIAASAIAGVFTLGIGTIVGLGITAAAATAVGVAGTAAGVGTAVATHYVASKYAKSEATFRRIRRQFDTLESFGYDLNQRVDEVHTALENISAQIDSICYGVLHNSTTTLIKDSVKRLNTVCTASYGNSSRLREEVKAKVEDLKAKFKMCTN